MRAGIWILAWLLMMISPAQATQALICVHEGRALKSLGVGDEASTMTVEIENRYTGANALAIVLVHNANSVMQLDPKLGWYVIVLKATHKKTGMEAPMRAVLIGRDGEICRQGMMPRVLIDRMLASIPAA